MREGPDPAFPLAFTGISHPKLLSSLSRISFSFPIPHPCPNLGESCFPGSSQISYPVNVSRIPHFIVAKSRIPGTRYILFSFDDNLASSPGIMFFKLLCNSMAKFRQQMWLNRFTIYFYPRIYGSGRDQHVYRIIDQNGRKKTRNL